MPHGSANITSIDAVRDLKLALQEFDADIRDALTQLLLEVRRAVEWIEHDRAQYWPREVRKASDVVSEARIALQRAELTISPNDHRYCYDERKALQKAKQRLRTAEEKVQAVRRWRVRVKKEAQEFEVQMAKITQYLDADFPRAVAALERMARALEKYTQQRSASGGSAGPSSALSSSGSSAAGQQSADERSEA